MVCARVFTITFARVRVLSDAVKLHSLAFALSIGFCVDKQQFRVNIHIYGTGK